MGKASSMAKAGAEETTESVATAAEGVKFALHKRSRAVLIRVKISRNSNYILVRNE